MCVLGTAFHKIENLKRAVGMKSTPPPPLKRMLLLWVSRTTHAVSPLPRTFCFSFYFITPHNPPPTPSPCTASLPHENPALTKAGAANPIHHHVRLGLHYWVRARLGARTGNALRCSPPGRGGYRDVQEARFSRHADAEEYGRRGRGSGGVFLSRVV